MRAIILGDGPMGRALSSALIERPHTTVTAVLGRPADGSGHPSRLFATPEVAFDFSRGPAVIGNAQRILAGGCRALVIGATGWDADRSRVERLLEEHEAVAVAGANFSFGVALFTRVVEEATRLFGRLEGYDPFLVEWHRRTKADRPSGTARELARRIVAAHPRKQRAADPTIGRPPEPEELEVVAIRAGASPGMHLVGFDAPGETVELRLTARDRSCYAAGAIAAAEWLLREPRPAGVHSFERVVDALVERPTPIPVGA